jgi:hypothetical protein
VKTDGDGNTGKIDGNTAGFLLGADHKLDGQNVRVWLLRLQPWELRRRQPSLLHGYR